MGLLLRRQRLQRAEVLLVHGEDVIEVCEILAAHLPRAQGGQTEWTNIVTCCYLCNRKKGGRTPREAGMALLVQPVQPNWVPAVTIRISMRSIPDAWRDYLYWTGDLSE